MSERLATLQFNFDELSILVDIIDRDRDITEYCSRAFRDINDMDTEKHQDFLKNRAELRSKLFSARLRAL